ncbi:MAG: xanthine dehydrogenase family protein molybdopterin-binding subunit [Armatimonadetes bacterium]|nr:xanthine dehydrogenase family protein molybdopterin-binding subunit [Armatimonadota bacterium]
MLLEPERYEHYEDLFYHFEATRREFIKVVGGGIVVLCLCGDALAQGRGGRGSGGAASQDLGAWLHIGEDGVATVYTGKVELGQNIRTSLAQAVAEELRVPPKSVQLVMGDTDLVPFDMGTFGSLTTPTMSPQLRRAAASAREMLLDLAAEQWKVERISLVVAEGKVTHAATNRSLTFGQLTRGQKLMRTIGGDIPLTPVDQWKIAGKSLRKVSGTEVVTGQHRHASDIKRPGMMYGKVLRPPSFGATLSSANLSAAEAMGAIALRDGDFVGVAATSDHLASQAFQAIDAKWQSSQQSSSSGELFDHLKKSATQAQVPGRAPGTSLGDADSRVRLEQGITSADLKLEQTYTVAYIAHAPLEPRAAVAEWNGDKLTVWTGTQRPFGVRGELAQAFRISEERVRVIAPDTGGGYGGKQTGEAAIEAARLAKASGKPVKVVWTREEEFSWAYFRPAGVIEVRSGVMKDGTLTAWEFHNYNSGASGIRTPYNIPNQKIQFHQTQSPLRQGSYRALAATANHFARETHLDELAQAVKIDPVQFRLKNLTDERQRAVLEAAAERFQWGKRKKGKDEGFGIACGNEKNSVVATCARIKIERPSGRVRVLHVVTAFECGAIINPDHLRNQIEGCTVMGLGGALFEAVEFENGKISNPRFSKYRVPRFSDTPHIETVLLDRKDLPSAGAGETPMVVVAPAIGNALFDATGVRLRSMPLAPKGMVA